MSWNERRYRTRRIDPHRGRNGPGSAHFIDLGDELDDYVRRVEFAKVMLSGLGEDDHALENAELAVETALKNDIMRDDLQTSTANYLTFLHATKAAYSREYLTRFVFVVDCLRRAPKRTMH